MWKYASCGFIVVIVIFLSFHSSSAINRFRFDLPSCFLSHSSSVSSSSPWSSSAEGNHLEASARGEIFKSTSPFSLSALSSPSLNDSVSWCLSLCTISSSSSSSSNTTATVHSNSTVLDFEYWMGQFDQSLSSSFPSASTSSPSTFLNSRPTTIKIVPYVCDKAPRFPMFTLSSSRGTSMSMCSTQQIFDKVWQEIQQLKSLHQFWFQSLFPSNSSSPLPSSSSSSSSSLLSSPSFKTGSYINEFPVSGNLSSLHPSFVTCREPTARVFSGGRAKEEYQSCSYHNIWYSTLDNRYYFYSPSSTVIPSSYFHMSSTFRPELIDHLQNLKGTFDYYEPRFVIMSDPMSKHHFHGVWDESFRRYMELTELCHTAFFVNRDAVRMIFHTGTSNSGYQPLNEQSELQSYHSLLSPLFAPSEDSKIFSPSYLQSRYNQHRYILYREINTMGKRIIRSTHIQESYWYDEGRTFYTTPYNKKYLRFLAKLLIQQVTLYNNLPSPFTDFDRRISMTESHSKQSSRVLRVWICKRRGTRSIVNAAELENGIKETFSPSLMDSIYQERVNLEVIPFSDLGSDFIQNIKFIFDVDIFITPHGQGESYIPFMKPGSIVLELLSFRHEPMKAFGELLAELASVQFRALASGHDIEGRFEGRNGLNCEVDRNSNMMADIPYIVDVLEDMMRENVFKRNSFIAHAIDDIVNPITIPFVPPFQLVH